MSKIDLSSTEEFRAFISQIISQVYEPKLQAKRNRLQSPNELAILLQNAKSNGVYRIDCDPKRYFILLVDHRNKELVSWDSIMPSDSTPLETAQLHAALADICKQYAYAYLAGQTCGAVPSSTERLCKRQMEQSNRGFCQAHDALIILLHLQTKMRYHQIQDKMLELLENEPCVFTSLFSTLTDLCKAWIMSMSPKNRSSLERFFFRSSLQKEIPDSDLDLVQSQLDLILTRFAALKDWKALYLNAVKETMTLEATKDLLEMEYAELQSEFQSQSQSASILTAARDLDTKEGSDQKWTSRVQAKIEKQMDRINGPVREIGKSSKRQTRVAATKAIPTESTISSSAPGPSHIESRYYNPKTGRTIKKGGPTYLKLLSEYSEQDLQH